MCMKRYEMIKDRKHFNFIIKNGHYNKDKNFVIYDVSRSDDSFPHFGIAIKTSIGKAVVRNKLKRQIRCIVDNNKKLFKNGKDYIIMIRNECLNKNYSELNESLINVMKGKK